MKKLGVVLLFIFGISRSLLAGDIAGFWKSVDEKTGKPQSIVAVYSYKGLYYGRMIATYGPDGKIEETIANPKDRAPGVEGDPYYCGLDFIWNLEPRDTGRFRGKIMDPQKGKVYDAVLWTKGGNLVVRGELLMFGRSQTWPPARDEDFPEGFSKPNLNDLVPVIHKVK